MPQIQHKVRYGCDATIVIGIGTEPLVTFKSDAETTDNPATAARWLINDLETTAARWLNQQRDYQANTPTSDRSKVQVIGTMTVNGVSHFVTLDASTNGNLHQAATGLVHAVQEALVAWAFQQEKKFKNDFPSALSVLDQ